MKQLTANKVYQVHLTGEEIILINQALQELPFRVVEKLINSFPDKIKENDNDL